MDYAKLNEDFEEASKTTVENIMDILHDIVRRHRVLSTSAC